MEAKVMEIHLIRHGKTLANERKLYCGRTDLPLSERGADEIARLAEQGVYPSADMFFTSGLVRTEQTIDIIYGNVEKTAIPRLAEFDFGSFELKSYDELKDREDYQAWITDETGEAGCPGGENKSVFTKRVIEGFNSIVNEAEKNARASVSAACHGGVIVSVMEHLYPGERNFYEWQPEPGRGYTLIYVSGRFHTYKKI